MIFARGGLSIVIAWGAWLLGHALLVWKGTDYVRHISVLSGWTSTAVVGMIAILIGCLLFAVAAASLVFSWWGLLSVGLVQVLLALLSGFAWAPSMYSFFVPRFLSTTLYVHHLYLGVHLVLGVVAIALAAAVALRPRLQIGGGTVRVVSLVAVVPALLAVPALVEAGGRNVRSFRMFLGPEFLVLLLFAVAVGLLGLVALSAALSGVGAASAGAVLSGIGFIGLLTPSLFSDLLGAGDFSFGLFQLVGSGGLLVIGLVLCAGGLASSASARFLPGS